MKKRSIFALVMAVVLVLFSIPAVPAEDSVITLIGENTEWRYLDDNTDPAEGLESLTAWTAADFDDSGWKTGTGSFGSKNGAIGEISSCGTPDNLINMYIDGTSTCIPTYFFRTTFTVEDVSKLGAVNYEFYADDAAVLYINGKVVVDSRISIPSEAQTTNMYYATYNTAQQTNWMTYEDYSEFIVNGENTVAVEVHNNQSASSDIYFGMNYMTAGTASGDEYAFTSVMLNVGSDETQRQLNWYTTTETTGQVQLALADDVVDGEFPTEYTTVDAKTNKATNKAGYYTNKATLTGLTENTEYVYRLVAGDKVSKIYNFKVGSFGDYTFAFVGDPQFGSASWSGQWSDTLQKLNDTFKAEIVVSAGDQINTGASEDEYDTFIVDELSFTAFAPSVGPWHDDPSVAYSEHYNLPNLSTKYGVTVTSANYWYTYNNTLFMHLNMADNSAVTSEHELFMKEAMAANPDAKWKIVVLHTALFSTGPHSVSEMTATRKSMSNLLTKLDIDVVLSGHDHVYVRSHLMDGINISDDVVKDGYAVDPKGVLHICANSSTGSKFYTKQVANADYVAFDNYAFRKSAVIFTVTDEKLSMTSYFLDNMSAFDTFTICKDKNEGIPTPSVPTTVAPACDHQTAVTGAKSATYFESGYTGDEVCSVCGTVVKKGEKTAKLKLKKPKATYKTKTKKISIKYKQVKAANKFQIRYKIKGKKYWNVTNFKAKSNKKVTRVLKKLKSGKRYVVSVRAMKSQGKATVAFSKWTKSKTVKVK